MVSIFWRTTSTSMQSCIWCQSCGFSSNTQLDVLFVFVWKFTKIIERFLDDSIYFIFFQNIVHLHLECSTPSLYWWYSTWTCCEICRNMLGKANAGKWTDKTKYYFFTFSNPNIFNLVQISRRWRLTGETKEFKHWEFREYSIADHFHIFFFTRSSSGLSLMLSWFCLFTIFLS